MTVTLVSPHSEFQRMYTQNDPAGSVTFTVTQTSVTLPYSPFPTLLYGIKPYTMSIATNSTTKTLPTGLSIDNTQSPPVITGTPSATFAAADFTFTITDAAGNILSDQGQQSSLNITVNARTSSTTSSTSLSYQVNDSVSYSPFGSGNVSNGVPPYTYYISSGTLPAGLSLDSSTGIVSGTITASQSAAAVVFKVQDSNGVSATATKTVTFTVVAELTSTLSNITTEALTLTAAMTSYTPIAALSGGVSPYTYIITSGTLPTGVTLNSSTGLVSGTPTATKSAADVTFGYFDSRGLTAHQTQTTTFSAAARTTATAVTTAQTLTVGQTGYSFAPLTSVSNGVTPYTYSITSGTLPGGLSLGASTGLVTGTVTSTKTAAAVVFSVRDTNGATAVTTSSVSYSAVNFSATASGTTSITVAAGNAITSYNPLTAVGGVSPFTYSITSGSLPSGVTLNSTSGLVSGTPTTAQSASSVTFSVGDVNGVTAATTQTTSFTVTATRGSTMFVGSSASSTIYQTYNWTCPAGVTSVSILCIGGGGAGARIGYDDYKHILGGGGGGLSYVNNYAVTPGTVYLIRAGNSGTAAAVVANGGFSAFYGGPTIAGGLICGASGGVGGRIQGYTAQGGGPVMGTGWSGGAGGPLTTWLSSTAFGIGGGGGAGGYSGNGGNGGSMNGIGSGPTGSQPPNYVAATAGTGGGGGGGGPGAYFNSPGNYQVVFANGGAGGGTYQYGFSTGNSGVAGATPSGSGGQGSNAPSSLGTSFGGGGSSTSSGNEIVAGYGIVRIVWPGDTRQFPSTDVNTDS